VAEVPGERAQDVRVDGVELVVGQRGNQRKGALAGLGEALGNPLLEQCVGGSRDPKRLQRSIRRL
jgi:hypothetical protein